MDSEQSTKKSRKRTPQPKTKQRTIKVLNANLHIRGFCEPGECIERGTEIDEKITAAFNAYQKEVGGNVSIDRYSISLEDYEKQQK
jgi:hypothetical protein